jgi:hypothetical protein
MGRRLARTLALLMDVGFLRDFTDNVEEPMGDGF